MESSILYLHLGGAAGTFAIVGFSFWAVFSGHAAHYNLLSKTLALLSVAQIASGSLLSLVSSEHGSLLRFCARIGLYMVLIIAAEFALFLRMKKIDTAFPLRFIVIPHAAVFVLFVWAIVSW